MKTSLVIKVYDGKFQRAALPGDAANDSEVKRIEHRLVVKFSKAHSFKSTPAYFTAGGMKLGREKTNHQADAVDMDGIKPIEFERGKAERVRVIRTEHINEIDAIDAQIEALHDQIQELKQQQQKLFDHAFYRGRALRKEEIEPA